ncbi:Protein NEDD1, partial [Varanus komodoensis]
LLRKFVDGRFCLATPHVWEDESGRLEHANPGGPGRAEGTAMQESIRFASSGDDDVKIWDSSSITVVDQFSPHTPSHPVSCVCWGSNSP